MLAKFGQLLRAIASGPDPAAIPKPSEVIPTIELGDCPADWHWPQGTFLYTGYAVEAGAAGVRSQVALENRAGSNSLAVVTAIRGMANNTTCHVRSAVSADLALFDNDGGEFVREPRTFRSLTPPQPHRSPACHILTDQAAGVGQAAALMYPVFYDGATYYSFREDSPWILMPGTALVLMPGADNVTCQGTFYWREREFDPEEARGSPFV